MKTLDEVIAGGHRRRQDEASREAQFLARRRRFIIMMTACAGAVSLVCYLLLLVAVPERWWFLALTPLPGLLSGWVIAGMGGGLLRSIIVHSAVQCAFMLLGLGLGGWSIEDSGMATVGPLIMLCMFILSWTVVGGLLGYIGEAFDQDHIQI